MIDRSESRLIAQERRNKALSTSQVQRAPRASRTHSEPTPAPTPETEPVAKARR
jgi:hypothetical protein